MLLGILGTHVVRLVFGWRSGDISFPTFGMSGRVVISTNSLFVNKLCDHVVGTSRLVHGYHMACIINLTEGQSSEIFDHSDVFTVRSVPVSERLNSEFILAQPGESISPSESSSVVSNEVLISVIN